MRLELTRSCDHYPLKVACIPISPPARRNVQSLRRSKERFVCPEQDSNLHTSRHAHLKRTRLPIPPSGRACINTSRDSRQAARLRLRIALRFFGLQNYVLHPEVVWTLFCLTAKKKSGKRDSNSRPRPWQGRALPTELFPQLSTDGRRHPRDVKRRRLELPRRT